MSHQNANDLRRLAETADGTREKEWYVVVRERKLVLQKEMPDSGEYAIVRTGWNGDGMHGGSEVRLSVTGGNVPEEADALFSSQSAIEKFVVPYYVRSLPLSDLKTELEKFYAEGVIAVYHDPGSVTRPVDEIGLYAVPISGKNFFLGP